MQFISIIYNLIKLLKILERANLICSWKWYTVERSDVEVEYWDYSGKARLIFVRW